MTLEAAGLRPRPTQRRMAEAVEATLAGGGVLMVEAPTGIGKTLAYLLPAALSGERVLISTHTKNLQDQLLHKDLPRLARLLAAQGITLSPAAAEAPGELRYAVMKGRRNYVCLERLEQHRGEQQTFSFAEAPAPEAPPDLAALQAWAKRSPRGDRAELPLLPQHSPLWDSVDARAEICTHSRCPSYERCFVTRMRAEAEAAELVVINHHLLMADLALKAKASLRGGARIFGGVLPPAEALVIDEAHRVDGTAAEHFGGGCSQAQLRALRRDLLRMQAGLSPSAAGLLGELASEALTAAQAVFSALPAAQEREPIRPKDPRLAAARAAQEPAGEALSELAEALTALAARYPEAEPLARRVTELFESMGFVLAAEAEGFVFWWEATGEQRQLGGAPAQVGPLLSRFLYPSFAKLVLTSATLSAGRAAAAPSDPEPPLAASSGFKYMRAELGLPSEAETLALESPFDFSQRAALYLPQDALPSDHPGAGARQAEQILSLIDRVEGGALCLFTSNRALFEAARRLRGRLRRPLFVQGEAPRRRLVERLVEEAPAVLLGTASFWEGVDVPGPALSLVVIDRLPFESPADPVAIARAQLAEEQERSAFASYHLPRAILKLRQGFGRLIRGPEDQGVVAILDRRLQDRPYGRRMLAALPPAARLHSLPELSAWCALRGLSGLRAPM